MRGLLLVLVVLAGCGGAEVAPAVCEPGEKRCFPEATIKTCDYMACPDGGAGRCIGWAGIQKCAGHNGNPPVPGACIPEPTAHCN